jgi:nucleotide-binding universal stress UspA family protein
MSTHGRSGLSRWFLGSVTDKVLHTATNPLLVIRSEEESYSPTEVKLDTIIVPLDQSEISRQVLPHVGALCGSNRFKVILVEVTPSEGEYHRYMYSRPLDASVTIYTGPYEEFSKAAEAAAMEHLHGVKEELRGQGISRVEERLLHGNPASAIVDFARETPHNLVAMTTHGRSGVGRWALGSVTDKVVRQSGNPVLVVRARVGAGVAMAPA